MGHVGGDRRENVPRALHLFGLAAHHQRQPALGGRRRAARKRRVHPAEPRLGAQALSHRGGGLGIGGGHVNQEHAAPRMGGEPVRAEDDGLHDLGRVEAKDHDV